MSPEEYQVVMLAWHDNLLDMERCAEMGRGGTEEDMDADLRDLQQRLSELAWKVGRLLWPEAGSLPALVRKYAGAVDRIDQNKMDRVIAEAVALQTFQDRDRADRAESRMRQMENTIEQRVAAEVHHRLYGEIPTPTERRKRVVVV